MPELPEVETTCAGIAPHLQGKYVTAVRIYQPQLRWRVPADLSDCLAGQTLLQLYRRAKYLLFRFATGHLIVHLGMSGSLRLVPAETSLRKHDHIDLIFNDNICLRYHDPRRFGCLLWTGASLESHKLLKNLGVEPLQAGFTGEYLKQRATGKSVPVKTFIMNQQVVVGVGNIYASEALFLAGIHPTRAADKVTLAEYVTLVRTIQQVLQQAITVGGTTLRDYVNSSGEKGYFSLQLNVYGRKGEPCIACQQPIERVMLGQRASFFCGKCQR